MTKLASSDLAAAASLLADLREAGLLLTSRRLAPIAPIAPIAPTAPIAAAPAPAPSPAAAAPQPESPPPAASVASPPPAAPAPASRPAPPPRVQYTPPAAPASAPAAVRPPVYRSDRVRQLLADMCKRGGFSGAVLADRSGLALAEFNAPFDLDAVAAFASVAGETIDQAERLLGKRDANNLTLDISYIEKIVVRRFPLAQQPAFLLVLCPQSIDERSEVELSIDLIVAVLAEEN